jgi:hypothetical protein
VGFDEKTQRKERDLMKLCWEGMDWCYLAYDRDQWWAVLNTVMNFWVLWSTENFLIAWGNIRFSKRTLLYGVGCLVSRCPNVHVFHNDLKVWMLVWASVFIITKV